MVYTEEKRDLFALPPEYMLVHCISADYALGAGVAKIFKDRYNVKDVLIRQNSKNIWDGKGRCEIIETVNENGERLLVANLVTKCRYFHKPDYDTLSSSLFSLKRQLAEYPDVKKLGMPLIGCGLDKLEWDKVSEIIKDIFADTELEITVCFL